MKKLLLLIGILSLQGCLSAMPITTIPKFEVTVVDAKTGEPLEGVVMLAEWFVYLKTPLGDQPKGNIWMAEFLSDENGKVGMQKRQQITNSKNGLASESGFPQFSFYKEGYERSIFNNFPKGLKYGPGQEYRDLFNGKIIRLKKYDKNSPSEWTNFFRMVANVKNYSRSRGLCVWDNFPYSMYAAISENSWNYSKVKDKSGDRKEKFIRDIYVSFPYCESFDEFFEKYPAW